MLLQRRASYRYREVLGRWPISFRVFGVVLTTASYLALLWGARASYSGYRHFPEARCLDLLRRRRKDRQRDLLRRMQEL